MIVLLLGLALAADPHVACQEGDGAACMSLAEVVDPSVKEAFVTRACENGVLEACSLPGGDFVDRRMALCERGDVEACWEALSYSSPSEANVARACASGWEDACPEGALTGVGAAIEGVVELPEIPLAAVKGGILVTSETAPKRLGIWTPAAGIAWGVELSAYDVTVNATDWGSDIVLGLGGRFQAVVTADGVTQTTKARRPPRPVFAWSVRKGVLEKKSENGDVTLSVDVPNGHLVTVSPDGSVVVALSRKGLLFFDGESGNLLQRRLGRCDNPWWTEEGHLLCTTRRGPGFLLHMSAGVASVPEVRVDRIVAPRWAEPGPEYAPRADAPRLRVEQTPVIREGEVTVRVEGDGVVVARGPTTSLLEAGVAQGLAPGLWDFWMLSDDGGIDKRTLRLEKDDVVLHVGEGTLVEPMRVRTSTGVPSPLSRVQVLLARNVLTTSYADFAGFVRLPALKIPGAMPRGYGWVDGELWTVPPSEWAAYTSNTAAGVVVKTRIGALRKGELILSVCGHDIEERRTSEAAVAVAMPRSGPCTVQVWRGLERVDVALPPELEAQ